MTSWRGALRDESGQDLVEYALLASFLSIVAVAVLWQISPLVRDLFMEIRTALMSVFSGVI